MTSMLQLTDVGQGCTMSTPTVCCQSYAASRATIRSGTPSCLVSRFVLVMLMLHSSECLDEAKRRVYEDPASNRSWNYCWLVLAKVHRDSLIPTYARAVASKPEMWGGRKPPAESVNQLADAFVQEWSAALAQLLRYWCVCIKPNSAHVSKTC